jgi:cell division protein FtsL
MAFFGIVPPATPPGQHARDGAVIPAGSAQTKKEPSALKKQLNKLSMRERIMLVCLVAAALIGAVAFFVVLPAVEAMQSIRVEIEDLEVQKSEIRVEPDLTPQYREQLEAAIKDYESYQQFYYPFMDPETIDRTVTNLLLDSCLVPIRLSMSPITAAELPPYATRTLVPKPVPIAEDLLTGENANGTAQTGSNDGSNDGSNPSGNGTGTAGTSGTAGGSEGGGGGATDEASGQADPLASNAEGTGEGEEGATDEGGLVVGSSIYCYTVDVEAKGWMTNLFTFLAATRDIIAMEVVSYSYDPPPQEPLVNAGQDVNTQNTTSNEPEGGTIILRIKLYVFVDGGVTSTDEE